MASEIRNQISAPPAPAFHAVKTQNGIATEPGISALQPDDFRAQVKRKIGDESPDVIELGALALWEKSLANAPIQTGDVHPAHANMNGYLDSLSVCLGNVLGTLSPAIWKAASDWKSDLLVTPGGSGRALLNGSLSPQGMATLLHDLGASQDVQGVRCAGLWNADETALLDKALSRLKRIAPEPYTQLKDVVVRTWVTGVAPDSPVRGNGGIFMGYSPDVVTVERPRVLTKGRAADSLEHHLFHEFAHLIDFRPDKRDFKSSEVSCFTRFREAHDCVSTYASTDAEEDFAETFAYVVQHHEKIQAHSDIFFHGLGPLSEKFQHIVGNVLQREVPKPSESWQVLETSLSQGQTPFGWREGATLHNGNKELQAALREIAFKWNLDDPSKELTDLPPGHKGKQLAFIADHLLAGSPHPSPAPDLQDIREEMEQHAQLKAQSQLIPRRLAELQGRARNSIALGADIPADLCRVAREQVLDSYYGLGRRLTKLDDLPPTAWAEHVQKDVPDPLLTQRLAECKDFAQVREVATRRHLELRELGECLRHRISTEKVPQADDLLSQDRDRFQISRASLTWKLQSDSLKQALEQLSGGSVTSLL